MKTLKECFELDIHKNNFTEVERMSLLEDAASIGRRDNIEKSLAEVVAVDNKLDEISLEKSRLESLIEEKTEKKELSPEQKQRLEDEQYLSERELEEEEIPTDEYAPLTDVITDDGINIEDPEFSEGTKPTEVITVKDLEKDIKPFYSELKNAPELVIVDSTTEFPKSLQNKLISMGKTIDNTRIKGAFWQNKIYLVASNFNTTKEAIRTTLHETVGHYGLKSLLGNEYSKIMTDVYDSKRSEIAAMLKERPNYKFNISSKEGQVKAANEWLSREAETNPTSTVIERIINAIRNALRKAGLKLKLTDSEIRQLLIKSGEHVRTGRKDSELKIFGPELQMMPKAEIWYSQMEKVLTDKLPNKGTPQTMRNSILNLAGLDKNLEPKKKSNAQFKSEELLWSGLLDELSSYKDQRGKITKQQISNYLDTHNVKVKEVLYGDKKSYEPKFSRGELEERAQLIERHKELIDDGRALDDIVDYEKREFNPDEQQMYDEINTELADVERTLEDTFYTAIRHDGAIEDISGRYLTALLKERKELSKKIGDALVNKEDSTPLFNRMANINTELKQRFGQEITDEGYVQPEGTPKWIAHTLPGGKDYKELVLTLPGKPETDIEWAERQYKKRGDRFATPEEMEMYRNDPSFLAANRKDLESEYDVHNFIYESPHWDSLFNPLVHVRFKEREDADGNRTLFIEEIQSDWHSDIRRRGLLKDEPDFVVKPVGKVVKYTQEEFKEKRPNWPLDSLVNDTWKNISIGELNNMSREDKDNVIRARLNKAFGKDAPIYTVEDNNNIQLATMFKSGAEKRASNYKVVDPLTQRDIINSEGVLRSWPTKEKAEKIAKEMKKQSSEGIEDAPFNSTYYLLAMKRMVRWAAENGFDSVSWTPGSVHFERWGSEYIGWRKVTEEDLKDQGKYRIRSDLAMYGGPLETRSFNTRKEAETYLKDELDTRDAPFDSEFEKEEFLKEAIEQVSLIDNDKKYTVVMPDGSLYAGGEFFDTKVEAENFILSERLLTRNAKIQTYSKWRESHGKITSKTPLKGWFVKTQRQIRGMAQGIDLEAESIARGINPKTSKIITTKEELREVIKDLADFESGQYSLHKFEEMVGARTNKVWEQMNEPPKKKWIIRDSEGDIVTKSREGGEYDTDYEFFNTKEDAEKELKEMSSIINQKAGEVEKFEDTTGYQMPRKEGFENIYNKKIVNLTNKFFNKKVWGNAKVQESNLQNKKELEFIDANRSIWVIDNEVGHIAEDHLGNRLEFTTRTAAINAAIEINVDEVGMSDVEARHWAEEYVREEKPIQKMWTLPITPEIKEKSISEGMPLFQLRHPKIEKAEINTYRDYVAENPTATTDQIIKDTDLTQYQVEQMQELSAENPELSEEPITWEESREPISKTDYKENRKSNKRYKILAQRAVSSTRRELKKEISRLFAPVSTRLGNINKKLKYAVRKLDYNTAVKSSRELKTVLPLLKKSRKMSRDDRADWDYARKHSDVETINRLVTRYGMKEEYKAVQGVLKQLRKEALDAGLSIGKIDNYWPRRLKDSEGFLKAMGKEMTGFNDIYTRAIQKKAIELEIDVDDMDADMRANIISNMILGGPTGLEGITAANRRKLKRIHPRLNQYYLDSNAALIEHIYEMRSTIEKRKFFGKIPDKVVKHRKQLYVAQNKINKLNKQLRKGEDVREKRNELIGQVLEHRAYINKYSKFRDYSANIGAYVDELVIKKKIKPDDQAEVNEILKARFHQMGTHGFVRLYKNLSYIDTMGSPISALTQIGDLTWAMYDAGIIPALKHAAKSIPHKRHKDVKITREDVGVAHIAQEFADPGTLGKAVAFVFKGVGLEKIDAIGKESLLNSSLEKYTNLAKSNPEKLKKEIEPIFEDETDSVINDLINGTISDNVKLLTYNRLLDFQPVSLSEMPQRYLTSGNGRIFYMLKTFTIKQFDAFRNEAISKIRSGNKKEKIQGIKNLVRLGSLFVLTNATADELKDWILGRETDLSDRVVDNLLRLAGSSKFITWKARTEGAGSALSRQILPPFKFIDSVSKDIYNAGDDKGLEVTSSIPLLGKLAYWHLGRGTKKRDDLWSRRFSKHKARNKKVYDRYLKAKNKQEFYTKHRDQILEYKRSTKFQGRLSKFTKMINKLSSMEETPSRTQRIQQLEKQRTELIKNYLSKGE